MALVTFVFLVLGRQGNILEVEVRQGLKQGLKLAIFWGPRFCYFVNRNYNGITVTSNFMGPASPRSVNFEGLQAIFAGHWPEGPPYFNPWVKGWFAVLFLFVCFVLLVCLFVFCLFLPLFYTMIEVNNKQKTSTYKWLVPSSFSEWERIIYQYRKPQYANFVIHYKKEWRLELDANWIIVISYSKFMAL